MNSTLEELPPLAALPLLDELPPLDEAPTASLFGEVTFEDLLAQAAMGPDDEEVSAQLAAQVREVLDSGEVDRALEMAAVLGATACMHPHLEDLANELGEEVMGRVQSHEGHDHSHQDTEGDDNEDKKSKRRKRTAVSLTELFQKYPMFTRPFGQK